MKTFGKLIDEYRKSPHFNILAGKTKEQYNRNFARLLEIGSHMPMLDDMQIAVARSRSRQPLAKFWWVSINEFEVNGDEVSNTVKNMLLTCLKIPYRWAVVGSFQITSNQNPVRDIPAWASTIAQFNPYKPDEINKVKQAVKDGKYPADLEPYAVLKVFAFHCGCRPTEAFDHEATQFTTKQGELLFQIFGAKGKESDVVSREVVMGKEEKWALDYFNKQRVFVPGEGDFKVRDNGLDNSAYTFRTDKGKKFNKITNHYKQIEVDEIAGIDSNRTFYDLRRGLATAMFEAGVDIRIIADRLGHSDVETTWRYVKLNSTGRSLSSKYRGLGS